MGIVLHTLYRYRQIAWNSLAVARGRGGDEAARGFMSICVSLADERRPDAGASLTCEHFCSVFDAEQD
jgi:hypothetical protein